MKGFNEQVEYIEIFIQCTTQENINNSDQDLKRKEKKLSL